MEMIVGSVQLSQEVAEAIMRYISARSDVCALVLEQSGTVCAVNRGGLDRLGMSKGELCGRTWPVLLDPTGSAAAEDAISHAFDGRPGGFVARVFGDRSPDFWSVEVVPLQRSTGAVVLALALCQPVRQRDDLREELREALHTLSNLTGITASSARLLERIDGGQRQKQIAEGLEDASRRARKVLGQLKPRVAQLLDDEEYRQDNTLRAG